MMLSRCFRTIAFTVPFLLVAACGGSGDDDGPGVDAAGADGGVPDASAPDAAAPDAGDPRACLGDAFACELRELDDCEQGYGCDRLDVCAGAASPCVELTTQGVCEGQHGCSWLAGTADCTGTAVSCGDLPAEDGCAGQLGCEVEATCAGVADACSSLSGWGCEHQLDCYREGSFTGTHVLRLVMSADPDTEFAWRARVAQTFQSDGSAIASVELLALSATERAPVGEPVTVDGVAIGADGAMTIELRELAVPAEANGISGTRMVIDATLTGQLADGGHECGTADGQVTEPVSFDLAGSTWTLQRVHRDAVGDALPADAPACPAP